MKITLFVSKVDHNDQPNIFIKIYIWQKFKAIGLCIGYEYTYTGYIYIYIYNT